MPETFEIKDRGAAAVFGSPRQRKIVLALIAEERSLSDLGRLTETPLNLLHHHIRRFIALGLVAITREEARAGAPIKFYRATARAFFVPAELMGAVPGAALAVKMRESLDRSLAGSLTGVTYSHDGDGPRMRMVKDPAPRTIAAELWLELRLSRADAADLADELRALLRRFEARATDKDRRYLVHAAVAPA